MNPYEVNYKELSNLNVLLIKQPNQTTIKLINTMPNPNTSIAEELRFELYIDAVGDGASRSRGIIAILMTATLVAALGMFNSLQKDYNWLTSRLESNREASRWLVFPDDRKEDLDSIKSPVNNLVSGLVYSDYMDNTGKLKHLPCPPNETNKIIYQTCKNALSWPEFREVLLRANKIDDSFFKKEIPAHLRYRFPDTYTDSYFDINSVKWEVVQRVLLTTEHMSVASREEMNNLINQYDRARIENAILIRMPFLGISFDVNWLSLISSVAFTLILFLLLYSLSRERKNLFLVFRMAEKKKIDKLDFYQMLSMRQVLNVPQSVDEYILSDAGQKHKRPPKKGFPKLEKSTRNLTNRMARYPLYMPALVWLGIIIHDTTTLWIGLSINPKLTLASFGTSILFGMIMLGFIYLCWKEWDEIIGIWDEEAEEIKEEHKLKIKGKKNEKT